jgi:hypothetical protein
MYIPMIYEIRDPHGTSELIVPVWLVLLPGPSGSAIDKIT